MKTSFLLIPIVAGLLSLAACSKDDLNVSLNSPDSAGSESKAQLKVKDGDARPGRNYSSNANSTTSEPPRNVPDAEDEEEATAAVLRAAEKLRRQGDFGSASIVYQRAISANPDSVGAYKGLAEVRSE